MKHVLIALTALLLFASCNKNNDGGGGGANFVINGIHDINLDPSSPGNEKLSLAINTVDAGGKQEPVSISVSGLPSGITADITPANGTPNFGTMITFKNDFSAAGGTYPIKIIGTAGSGTKEYTLNLIVPSFKGWIISYPVGPVHYVFSQSAMTVRTGSSTPGDFPQIVINAGSDRITLSFNETEGLPTGDKTYTTVESKNIGAGEVEVEVYDISGKTPGNGWFMSDNGGKVKVSVKNGKLQISCTGLACHSSFGPGVTLAVSAAQ